MEKYFRIYDTPLRFISYFYQTNLVRQINPDKVLEIGIGNKTVSNYLKEHGVNLTTCDINKELEPDYVADIRRLPFKNNSFNAVLAYEILEHLPWEDVEIALNELHRVSKKNVIISLPFYAASFETVLKFPGLKRISNKPYLDLFFRIPYFFRTQESKEHYWEIGQKGYPLKKIRRLLGKNFKIEKELRPPLNSYHHFFLLKVKDK